MRQFLYQLADRLQLARYAAEERATAFIETVILFPLLCTLLIGCWDLGQGILMNQKTIGASQIIGDLVARDRSVTMTSLQQMIRAGELAYEPYSTTEFGYDIVSIEFDAAGNPDILWRVTDNMTPNDAAVESTIGLGTTGDGLVVVTTSYRYDPFFAHFVVDEINMQEVAFYHGRMSATVACADCPS